MQDFKFANVLLETNPRSVNYPSLYCRASSPVVFDRSMREWELYGPGTFDFTTYFNALSVTKLNEYTIAKGYRLHLELKGAACRISQTTADAFAHTPDVLDSASLEMEPTDEWRSLDFDLEVPSTAIVIGFLIEAEGSVYIRNSYYTVQVDEEEMNEVELSLCTTTFKKEDFITSNIDSVKRNIVRSDNEIADHFTMHVIDNGRTLDAEGLTGENVTVHPNNNVGGAGGFARGMIEALRQPVPATNVLLMDDDVAVSPESIIRTYNLLRILKEEYREAFISGAMLNYEIGEDLWEDLGFMTDGGFCRPVKPNLRMTLLHDIVLNEQLEPNKEQKKAMYAAWWYCCIPASTIRREGLPLPVFVRFDDVEYGLRCAPKFITMNSICIWHLSFHSRYNAAVERYQTTRNAFIAQATTGMAPNADFLLELRHNMQVELKKFNYTNAELVLDGFEDFLKGPEFIGTPVAEECFMRANRNAEKLVAFDELREQTKDIEGFDMDDLDSLEVYRDEPRTRSEALFDFLTFNGQRIVPAQGDDADEAAVIPAEGWAYPPGKIRKKNTIVAIDAFNRKGVVRHMDRERFKAIMKRYNDDMSHYKKHKDELEKRYAAARDRLTSVDFWLEYLGID